MGEKTVQDVLHAHGVVDPSAVVAELRAQGLLLEAEPNQLVVRIPVQREYESGDWETSTPGYWYATATEFEVLLDTLETQVAVSFGFEIENGDPFPDGLDALTKQLLKKYEPLLEAAIEESKNKPKLELKFTQEDIERVLR